MTEQRWRCPRCGHVVVLRRERAEAAGCFRCVVLMERVVEQDPPREHDEDGLNARTIWMEP